MIYRVYLALCAWKKEQECISILFAAYKNADNKKIANRNKRVQTWKLMQKSQKLKKGSNTTMKKFLLGSLLVASCLIGTVASADQGSEVHFGSNYISVYSSNSNGNEIVFGWNYALPLTILGNANINGLELSFCWNIGIGSMNGDTTGTNRFYNDDVKIFVRY